MKTMLLIVMASTAFILAGCATTADYSEPVLRLEQAINDSSSSIKSIDADLTTRRNVKLKKLIIERKLLLDSADDQCAAGKGKCSLIVLEAKGGEANRVSDYPLASTIPKGLLALNMVKIYVSRLKSIIEADTAAKVTASANSTLGSLEEIANRLAKENGESVGKNKITEYKEPVMGLIEWSTERYVERVKKEALAKATRDAHPVIKDLTVFYATASKSLKVAEFAESHTSFTVKQEQYDEQNQISESSVDAYVQAAANYDATLKAEAASPLKAFETAHEQLMKQLNGKDEKKVTLVDVSSAIERLEQEAKAIKALVDGFKNVSNSTESGDK